MPVLLFPAAGERGLTDVGGILTLDTNLLGAIVIASISVWVHNHYFEHKLPNGDSFQIIVGLTVPQVREEMTQILNPKTA